MGKKVAIPNCSLAIEFETLRSQLHVCMPTRRDGMDSFGCDLIQNCQFQRSQIGELRVHQRDLGPRKASGFIFWTLKVFFFAGSFG